MADSELGAMQAVLEALEPLEQVQRVRVIQYAASRLDVQLSPPVPSVPDDEPRSPKVPQPVQDRSWGHFAELFDAANPQTEPERLLVAAYWEQKYNGAEDFASLTLNRQLKELGRGATETAHSLEALRSTKPALILQLKKSGRSRQARKSYKLTSEGVRKVEQMLSDGT